MRILLFLGVVLFVVIVSGFAWWFLYTGDLPNVDELSRLAPETPTSATQPCTRLPTLAIPSSEINKNVRLVMAADEEAETSPSFPLTVAIHTICDARSGYALLARSERLAFHLKRRFTADQLVAIHLNGYIFDDKYTGIEETSEHMIGKHAAILELDEAALIFARSHFIEDPTPELLLQRRNGLLEIMVSKKLITAQQAEEARSKPLPAAKHQRPPEGT